MRATWALLRKEMDEHAGRLKAITLLLLIAWFAAWAAASKGEGMISAFQHVARFAGWPLVCASLYLGHGLFVAELFGRTQRFVEALPIRKGHVLLVKASFGAAALGVSAAIALLAAAVMAGKSEPVESRFLLVLSVRLGAYVVCLWSIVLLLGLLGRLRLPIALASIIALVATHQYTSWDVMRFGPLALIDAHSFPFERTQIPWRAVAEAVTLSLAAFGAALGFARLREGSVVEALARPLGPREVAALSLLGTAALIVFISAPPAEKPAPYAFTTDRIVRLPGIEIGYFEDSLRDTAEALGARLERMLGEIKVELDWQWLPPVRVVHAPDVRPGRSVLAASHHESGLVIRANLAAPSDVMTTRLLASTVHALVVARSRGGALFETRHWMLDGYALHAALRGHAAPTPPTGLDPFWLDALAAAQLVPVGPAFLRDYLVASERLGDDGASALAESGWRVLEAERGHAAVKALADAAFGPVGKSDVRGAWQARRTSKQVFAEAGVGDWEAFLRSWVATLARDRNKPPFRAALDDVVAAEVRAEVRPDSTRAIVLRARLKAPPATICTVQERKLPPFDAPVDPDLLESKQFAWPEGDTVERLVEGDYASGERALVVLDCDLPPFTGAVRLLAERVTIP